MANRAARALIARAASLSFGSSLRTCSQASMAFCQWRFNSSTCAKCRKKSAPFARSRTDSSNHSASSRYSAPSAASAATRATATSHGLLKKAFSQRSRARLQSPLAPARTAITLIALLHAPTNTPTLAGSPRNLHLWACRRAIRYRTLSGASLHADLNISIAYLKFDPRDASLPKSKRISALFADPSDDPESVTISHLSSLAAAGPPRKA